MCAFVQDILGMYVPQINHIAAGYHVLRCRTCGMEFAVRRQFFETVFWIYKHFKIILKDVISIVDLFFLLQN